MYLRILPVETLRQVVEDLVAVVHELNATNRDMARAVREWQRASGADQYRRRYERRGRALVVWAAQPAEAAMIECRCPVEVGPREEIMGGGPKLRPGSQRSAQVHREGCANACACAVVTVRYGNRDQRVRRHVLGCSIGAVRAEETL